MKWEVLRMGLFDIFKKKNAVSTAPKSSSAEPTLMDDIPVAADWIVAALNSSGYVVDYSLESLKEVDRFFDEQSGPDGILQRHGVGRILFAIGSYVGQVAIKCCGGHWVTDDTDPQGEINIEVVLADGTHMWPAQRAIKRYQLGSEESMYAYLLAASGKGTPLTF